MPKQITELPVAESVVDTDLVIIKEGLHDKQATIAQVTDNTGTAIARATSKATPVDADMLALSDSAASNVLKKLTWANLKATLVTYFQSIVLTWALRQIFTAGIKLPVNEGIRFGGGDVATNADFDASEVATTDAIFRFLRNTNTSGNRQIIVYKGDGSATVALLFNADTNVLQVGGNTVWHAGNDGSGSGLDAALLEGNSIGAAVGNIVQLEDVGGSPGLPAVDGSQLTNIADSDENVKASGTDTTPGTLTDKFTEGDGVTITLLNSGADENLQLSVNLTKIPRQHLIVRAASDGQTVVSFGDSIIDDDSAAQGFVKNHLIYRNGQLLINSLFDALISPATGNYNVTDANTGEITLVAGSEAVTGDIFTYVDIQDTEATPA